MEGYQFYDLYCMKIRLAHADSPPKPWIELNARTRQVWDELARLMK